MELFEELFVLLLPACWALGVVQEVFRAGHCRTVSAGVVLDVLHALRVESVLPISPSERIVNWVHEWIG